MSSNNTRGKKTSSGSGSKVVLTTIADTTWRMFVPSVGGTVLGLWGDSTWRTAPWLLFTGIILGSTIAVLAVKMQYDKLK